MSILLNPINLVANSEHNVFFISDTHFGHDRDFIWGKRGFQGVLEHDGELIRRWNSVVSNQDTVVHCGDIMFGGGGLSRLENYFEQLNFRDLILLPGNHHAGVKQYLHAYQDGLAMYDFNGIVKNVQLVPNYIELVVNRQPIVVCHYPIASWNGLGHGNWCICGHCHGSFPGSQLAAQAGKILDVGVEVVLQPRSFNEIQEIMNTKSVKYVDHHTNDIKNPL